MGNCVLTADCVRGLNKVWERKGLRTFCIESKIVLRGLDK